MATQSQPCVSSIDSFSVFNADMSTHFGPESPRPFSVYSERQVHHLPIERDPLSKGLFNFGPVYNARFAFELGKFGEINCDDHVAYVGPNRGSVLTHLRSELSLLHPLLHLLPSASSQAFQDAAQEDDDGDKWTVEDSAEDFFRDYRTRSGPTFDRIVVRDAHGMLKDPAEFYANAMRALDSRRGKLVLIHRPVPITHLPFRSSLVKEIIKDAPGVHAVLQEFSVPGHDVEWEVVQIPMLMTKMKWLSMLHHRFPVELSEFTDAQMAETLRELIDGPFKYCGNSFECEDVLLFACMSPRDDMEGMEYRRAINSSSIGRHKGAVKEMRRGVEVACGGSPDRVTTLSAATRVDPADRFPLVQRCAVGFTHDMSQVYRV